MVGGRIVATRRPRGATYQEILVQGTGCEWRDVVRVRTAELATLPTGGQIWWQRERMFVKAPGATAEIEIPRISGAYR